MRLPLQVGITATWAAARVALAVFPGLAFAGLGVRLVIWTEGNGDEVLAIPFVAALLFLGYAWFYLRLALRARASDLRFHDDHLAIDGGVHRGRRIPWTELTAPYAQVEQAKEARLVLWKLPLAAIAAAGDGDVDPEEKVPAWRLAVWHQGTRLELAESDRPIEAASMRAAVATIELAGSPLVLVGHSHVALRIVQSGAGLDGGLAPAGTELETGGVRALLNPGSVGQPRDGDPRAAYLLLDLDAARASFRRVEYDVERTQREMREAGLPELLAARLELGQ